VARYVVDVMPKSEILGFDGVVDVRQGKRFEVELAGEASEETLAEVRKMAETLLSNPVIEDYSVSTAEPVEAPA
jgi:phosphoribosylformylglycinamidine synthase PurS subunit